MDGKEILDYCLKKHGAYLDYPFGEIPICVKVKGRLFAQLYPKENDYKITLKCEPMLGDFYRTQYPGEMCIRDSASSSPTQPDVSSNPDEGSATQQL